MVAGRPLFIDLGADLYFMVEAEEEEAAVAAACMARTSRPSSSIFDHELGGRPALSDVIGVSRLVLGIRRQRKRRKIVEILEKVTNTRAGDRNSGHGAAALAVRFARARLAVPAPRDCLTDSLALIAWLGGKGSDCELVFGAKLDPFAAHCWVQSGDLLLSDRLEEIDRFTPVGIVQCTHDTL